MALTFDPAKHEYRCDGAVVPGVTEIIRAAGLAIVPPGATDWHMGRGRVVHEATALYDKNDLDESSVDPEARGFVAAYIAFRKTAGADVEIKEIETPRYNRELRYAGTPDRYVKWRGQPAVLELKSGAPEVAHRAQTSAYQGLITCGLRLALYLKSDGHWSLETHKDPNDWPIFVAACSLWHFRHAHGLLEVR